MMKVAGLCRIIDLNAPKKLSPRPLTASREYYNTAINRLYYACYYAASALLIKNKFEAHTHAGVKQLLGLHFVTTGKLAPDYARFYAQLFNNRIAGDYDDFVVFDKETVNVIIPQAQQFIRAIEELLIR